MNLPSELGELSVNRHSAGVDIVDSHGDLVATVPLDGTGRDEDNARLLAAAPEMRHALRLAFNDYAQMGCEHDPLTNPDPERCACCAVGAVISKVGGAL